MYQIIFYRDKKGLNEVEEYLKVLRNKTDKESNIKYAKVSGYIEYLSRKGLKIGMPYIKHISKDLWELRPLKDRIFFGVLEDNNFVILNRFVKSTKKTPKSEIIQATKLLKRYKEEMDNEKKTK